MPGLRAPRIWSATRVCRLIELRRAGKQVLVIASDLGLSAQAVANRLHRLRRVGVQVYDHRQPWTLSQRLVLRRLYAQRKSVEDIAAALGRDQRSVRSKAQKMGLLFGVQADVLPVAVRPGGSRQSLVRPVLGV